MQFGQNLPSACQAINDGLRHCSDKDWNYSRIVLQLRPLSQLQTPYVLWVEQIDITEKSGKHELSRLNREISWGCRHGDELSILELASLRINKALLESTSDDYWGLRRPIVRLVKKQELERQGIADAFWYEVSEVGGEEFDNR